MPVLVDRSIEDAVIAECLIKTQAKAQGYGRLSVPDFWTSQSHSMIRTQNGIQPFIPFDWQRCFIDNITEREMVLKSRDVGSSEICVRYFCWLMLKDGGNVLIKADKWDNAKNLIRIARQYLTSLPSGERPTLIKDNETELELQGIGSVKAMAQGAGRSERCRYLLMTERAFWANPDEELAAISGALVAGGYEVIESTANGFNEYHSLWQDGQNGYRKTFVGRDENPTHDGRWREAKEQQLAGQGQKLKQEYPACVTAETRIGTGTGILPITSVLVGGATNQGTVTAQHSSGVADVYRLTTNLGYSFRGSGNHPVILIDGSAVRIDQVECGQVACLASPKLSDIPAVVQWRRAGVDCSVSIDEDWGLFLGLFMADGSYHKDTLSIVCCGKDSDVVEVVTGLIGKLFDLKPQIRQTGTNKGGTEVRVSSKALRETFGELGLIETADGWLKRKVCVPPFIWRSPRPIVTQFLRGLFEGDGFSDYSTPRIMLFSRYEQFIRDVQLLLLAFGITSKVNIQRKKAGDGHYYEGRELALRYEESLRFNEQIGFISSRKRARCKERPNTPASVAARKPLVMEDVIVSVTPEGEEEVFNLTIEGSHLFDANGILTHNTPNEAFVTSGNCLFDVERIQEMLQYCKPPIATQQNGAVKIWQHPRVGRRYVAGADVAEGIDVGNNRLDYSGVAVYDWQTCQHVADLHGQWDVDTFASAADTLCRSYNNAFLGVERNNHGHAVLSVLKRLNYPALYYHAELDRELKTGKQTTTKTAGWPTNRQTKPVLENTLASLIASGGINSYDSAFWDECLSYVRHGDGTTGAQQGCHDDRVIKHMVALQIREHMPAAAGNGLVAGRFRIKG